MILALVVLSFGSPSIKPAVTLDLESIQEPGPDLLPTCLEFCIENSTGTR